MGMQMFLFQSFHVFDEVFYLAGGTRNDFCLAVDRQFAQFDRLSVHTQTSHDARELVIVVTCAQTQTRRPAVT